MADMDKWPDAAVYALRTTQQHHVQLSMMADHKANMLIGAAFVVFTLAIGQSATGQPSLPLIILAVSACTAGGLAAFAVMPSIHGRKGTPSNWLFFGNFSTVEEERFLDHMLNSEFRDTESTFRAMLRDIHQMGNVLATKKYRYLGYAYRVFLAGISLSVLTYLAELFTGPLL